MNFTLLNWLSEVMVFVNFAGLKRWKELIFFILCPVINNIYHHFSPLLYTISPDMMIPYDDPERKDNGKKL